jgi:hypothetical protein
LSWSFSQDTILSRPHPAIPTSRISVKVNDPGISCLFAKINSVAPASLCSRGQPLAVFPVLGDSRSTHFFLQQALQCVLTILRPQAVGRVHDPYYSIGRFEVVPPVRPKCPLTTDIPNVQCVTIQNSKGYQGLPAVRSRSIRALTYPLYPNDLMLNPNVGLTVLMSSPLSFFKIVVLPALSNPLNERSRSGIMGWD